MSSFFKMSANKHTHGQFPYHFKDSWTSRNQSVDSKGRMSVLDLNIAETGEEVKDRVMQCKRDFGQVEH